MKIKRKHNIRLVKPSLELQSEYMEMVREFVSAGEVMDHKELQLALEDFPAYVNNCVKWERGIDLPDKWVPSSTFCLIRDDNVILGTSSLRYKLTDKLRLFGGHIGYKIRPAQRRKGYGTEILKLTLIEAGRLGFMRFLVTCDDDNIASAKIIEKNGGILHDKCDRGDLGKLTRRYWVDLNNLTLT